VNVPTDLLSSIGICVGAAALIAAVTWRFKQPLIIAYLATGVIIGPHIGLRWITNDESIRTVAEIGLILLLFVIGLEIDLRKMASGGAAVLLTGALQVPICVALGLGFFYVLGTGNAPHNYALLYLAACMSVSSTLVVVKILNDKFELDTLPGRITLGVLVLQDLWAVAMLAVSRTSSTPTSSRCSGRCGAARCSSSPASRWPSTRCRSCFGPSRRRQSSSWSRRSAGASSSQGRPA
jgi:Kef-type K+ transport system membrane component KefB